MSTIPSNQFKSLWPERWYRRLWEAVANRILDESARLGRVSDATLKERCTQCRSRIRLQPVKEDELVEAFSLVREVSARVHGIRHHHVQVLGALAMSHGWIAEMGTGEGKTLTSLMTIILLAMKGKGCHVFTANDYLAGRDRDFAQPVFDWFKLTSAVLPPQDPDTDRAMYYRAAVTYGSEKEFGFDFLRDRLNRVANLDRSFSETGSRSTIAIQNGLRFALIDEADSILIDQATTPLIISCPRPPSDEDLQLIYWSDQVAGRLAASVDYSMDPQRQSARLTRRGCRSLKLTQKPLPIANLPAEIVYTQVERAIAARHFYRENQEYMVIDQRIEIIDQGTGRILHGRKWRDGLQQAIEIQAGLTPSDSTGSAARITLQGYLKNYEFLCGMTGTATEAERELKRIYGLRLMKIAHHRPSQLRREPARIFATSDQKWAALIADVETVLAAGRAVLVGTTSITASERCAGLLREREHTVQVLHAKHDRDEAEIVANAGLPGRITVATNMAGRGTDIKLHPDVRSAGGLHVILSEMNRSPRVDRQLAGRAARQEDPGSFQIYASLEDELLQVLGARIVTTLKHRAETHANGELPQSWLAYFQRAQQRLEKRGEEERRQLMSREQQKHHSLVPLGLDPVVEMPIE